MGYYYDIGPMDFWLEDYPSSSVPPSEFETVFIYMVVFLLFFCCFLVWLDEKRMKKNRHYTHKSYNPVPGRAADSRTAVPLFITNPKIEYRS